MTTKEINQEARQKLVDEISKRITLSFMVAQRSLDFAKAHADEAMIQAEGFSLDDSIKELKETSDWLGYVVSGLEHDMERWGKLIELAKEIRESEGE
jgi:hypothetical protein